MSSLYGDWERQLKRESDDERVAISIDLLSKIALSLDNIDNSLRIIANTLSREDGRNADA